MVIALFYGSLAASRSWKKGYAQLTATLIEMAVRIARELGLNAEPRETTAIPPRNSFLAKGISTVSPNQSWNSEYGLPRWIVDEERRRIWWQLYVLDKVSMAVSDRPAQISERDCQARIPCSNYIWLREAESHETHGVNLGSELLGIPAQSMFSGFGETVWSEVGAWVVVFRAIGVVFGEFHQASQCGPFEGIDEADGLSTSSVRSTK